MLGIAPREIVLDVLMNVLGDRSVGLFVMVLQRQEVIASLVQDLCRHRGLASHGINGHHTAVDGQQLPKSWNRGDLIRLAVRLQLANDETAVLRTPSRQHVQGGGCRGSVKRCPHRFAVERDNGPMGQRCDGAGPGQKAGLKALRIEAGKDAANGIMRGNAVGQGQESLEPMAFTLAKEFHILKSFAARQKRTHGNDQDIKEVVLLGSLDARVFSVVEMVDN